MSIAPDTFLNDWNVAEFYHLAKFLSWESKAQRDYQEIMTAKNKAASK